MLNVFIIINVTLQRSIRRHTLAKQYRLNDCIAVNSVADGRDNVSVFGPVLILEVKENSTVIRGLHIIACIAVLTCKQLCILRRKQRKIQLTGLHLHCLCIIICHNLKYNCINISCTGKILLILFHCNSLSCIPAYKLIWSCSNWCTEKVRCLPIFTL